MSNTYFFDMLLKIGLLLTYFAYFSECAKPEFVKDAEKIRAACVAENGVKEELIDNCNDGDFAEDRALKCYMHCLYQKFDMLKPDETIDTEAILNYIPDDFRAHYEPAIRTCDSISAPDTCEVAFLTHKCYYATSPDLYHII